MTQTIVSFDVNDILEYASGIGGVSAYEAVKRAYQMAFDAHAGQFRKSGEPYITHCIAVARILKDLNADIATIAAGFLHDVLEDTSYQAETLREMMGEDVTNLVQGVTKLKIVEDMSNRPYEDEAESFRKMFLAMAEDLRIVMIKLADRLHNMRTLNALSQDRQMRLAKETLEVWAPLANRMGIWQVKSELEDLSFRVTNPQLYLEIERYLSEHKADRQKEMEAIRKRLERILDEHHLSATVLGRPKHIYSIYQKMRRKELPLEKIYDIRAVRIIVSGVEDCYATLGVIHTSWPPIPNEFDDYIASPKDNGYQSLHTAVYYEDGRPLEVQIRTREMDIQAEFGIAAHWKYKEGGRSTSYDERINWLRMMMEWRQETSDPRMFLDGMKTDIFQDRVYVFTPRGDIIDLPAGATPIDFAYMVHTDIGHRCRGAKVNGKLVPLDYVLKTGEQVEILTTKRGGPSRDWLNPNLGLVKTQRARSKIRAWFKKQDREQNLTQGRLLLERELHRLSVSGVNFEKLARDMEYRSPDDFFVALGCGDLPIGRVIKMLSELPSELPPVSTPSPTATDAVNVVGLKGLLTNMARCCHPAAGDQIIGYVTRGRGVSIHRSDCPNVLRIKDRERLVQVSWGERVHTYPVPIRIHAFDRQGLMNDVMGLLANEGINVIDANVNVNHNMAHMRLVLEVRDLFQLSRVLTRLENLQNVLEVQRVKPG
ncbi:MAG: RelA/SpoT family protein [Candidatus Villigracilaceae bacterium]